MNGFECITEILINRFIAFEICVPAICFEEELSTLNEWDTKLAEIGIPRMLAPFKNLTSLSLCLSSFGISSYFRCLSRIIQKLPNLKGLELDVRWYIFKDFWSGVEEEIWSDFENGFDVQKSHKPSLKSLRIDCCARSPTEHGSINTYSELESYKFLAEHFWEGIWNSGHLFKGVTHLEIIFSRLALKIMGQLQNSMVFKIIFPELESLHVSEGFKFITMPSNPIHLETCRRVKRLRLGNLGMEHLKDEDVRTWILNEPGQVKLILSTLLVYESLEAFRERRRVIFGS